MGILTREKLASYYDLFKAIDVTFSKEIIQVTGLVPNQVYLKCIGDFWPCVIFSTSFQGAKVIVNIKSGILQKLEKANNLISLRLCFKFPDTPSPLAFSVNTKSIGYTPYGNSNDMAIFNLTFTQRPSDDLIEIMGRILDAKINSAKRREERIPITADSARKLKLLKESSVYIQGVPRNCILRDVAFSGVKIIMMGVAKFLINKDVDINISFDDPRESFTIKGKFMRSEAVEGRKELVSLVLLFDESVVPIGYKIRINEYLSHVRADARGTEKSVPDGDLPPLAAKSPQAAPLPKAPLPPPPAPAAPPPAAPSPAAAAAAAPQAPAAPPVSPNPRPSLDDDLDLNLEF